MKKLLAILMLLPIIAFGKTIELNKSNSIILNDYFYGDSVNKVMEAAKKLDKIEGAENSPIYLSINSGGGYISDGLEMIAMLKGLKRPVHTISHFAASMGFQTVQGLGSRYLYPHGTLMSHKARGMAYGEFPGQLDNRLNSSKRQVELMNQVAVARTNGKQTMESYLKLIENEYWCTSVDCKKAGFSDQEVLVKCSESLSGTHTNIEKFLYQGYVIDYIYEYSDCPVQTNPLNMTILVDGKVYFTTKNKTTSREYDEFMVTEKQGRYLKERMKIRLDAVLNPSLIIEKNKNNAR